MFRTILKYKKLSIFGLGSSSYISYEYSTRSTKHLEAERLLFKNNIKHTNFELKQVKIGEDKFINTFITEFDPNKNTLVLVHGWGSGLALWSSNIDDLSKKYNIYCLDLLGFGRSSRPKFRGTTAEDAKKFWVESFELWRKELGLKDFTLLGHSLGGFITTSYALEYPNHVDKLILAAPVGIEPWKFPQRTGFFPKFLKFIVDYNFTPQSILRVLGPFGQKFWDNIGEKSKYRELDKDGWDYLYYNQVAKKSGDLAFMRLVSLNGWEYPLFDKLKELKIPLRIIYGERDYIRPSFGPTVVDHLKHIKCDFKIVEGVGHHMYWKSKEFANYVLSF